MTDTETVTDAVADTVTDERKTCTVCGEIKPLHEFQRRSGRRAGHESRRGTCKSCMRSRRTVLEPAKPPAVKEPAQPAKAKSSRKASAAKEPAQPAKAKGSRKAPAAKEPAQPTKANVSRKPPRPAERPRKRPLETAGPPAVHPTDASALAPTRKGVVRMRGRTDKGRRWIQEIDVELARTLVREHAAVVVNRHTIRRLFTNKDFRHFILTRDHHVCRYCGEYGDTIDHLLPRAKGGHTTPDNCVCACMACNQSKADLAPEDFPIVYSGAAGRR